MSRAKKVFVIYFVICFCSTGELMAQEQGAVQCKKNPETGLIVCDDGEIIKVAHPKKLTPEEINKLRKTIRPVTDNGTKGSAAHPAEDNGSSQATGPLSKEEK